MECYERTCCGLGLDYLGFWNGACQRVLEYIFCSNHFWVLERIFGGRKTNADGGVAMTGFNSKRAAAADKLWDRPSVAFDEWWNGDNDESTNPFRLDSGAYWAWAGWKAALAQPAQEQWNAALDEAASRIGEIKGFGQATQDSFATFIKGLKK
jgi:hypothetical protein